MKNISLTTILFFFLLTGSAMCSMFIIRPLVRAEQVKHQGLSTRDAFLSKNTRLINRNSEVILVRSGNFTTITMSNDFKGNVKDFAMVVPVPVVLKEGDIKTVSNQMFTMLDAYSSPRIEEKADYNPCENQVASNRRYNQTTAVDSHMKTTAVQPVSPKIDPYKVKVEATYKIDEYDIIILSAQESNGLKLWLKDNDYLFPEKADKILEPYIKNKMKFFVVKINADRLKERGNKINPLQIKFESPKFTLPIRLGMTNADDFQDMVVYAITDVGRVECANYRTVNIPTNRNIPTFVKKDFAKFYKDLFEREYEYQGKNAIFLEYAWNISPNGLRKCNPCIANAPTLNDMVNMGVNWDTRAKGVHFTRLHVRYTEDKFPQDLLFQVTPNKATFQAKYIVTKPAKGDFSCYLGQEYLTDVINRRQRELDELQHLAGWDPNDRPLYVKGYQDMLNNEVDRNDLILPFIPQNDGNGMLPKLIFTLLIALSVILFLGRSYSRSSKRKIPSV
ncbi:MAG: DUF2330 domain-containing protein [Flavobacteriales bacterium]|nr:DUF2330 domain-containing protein [Flavobacteriales bacterium]